MDDGLEGWILTAMQQLTWEAGYDPTRPDEIPYLDREAVVERAAALMEAAGG
jgi:hypothetical protein